MSDGPICRNCQHPKSEHGRATFGSQMGSHLICPWQELSPGLLLKTFRPADENTREYDIGRVLAMCQDQRLSRDIKALARLVADLAGAHHVYGPETP